MVTGTSREPPELPDSPTAVKAAGMGAPPSDLAELATLRSQLEELTRRIEQVAGRYDERADSGVSTDLYAAERSLFGARRALDRAIATLQDLAG